MSQGSNPLDRSGRAQTAGSKIRLPEAFKNAVLWNWSCRDSNRRPNAARAAMRWQPSQKSRMQGRGVGQLIGGIDARAPLVFVGERGDMIEAEPVVNREFRVDAPLVLCVKATKKKEEVP